MKVVLASNLNKPAEVTFETAYSGGKLMLAEWEHPVVINLDTASIHDPCPILLYHDPIKRVGFVTGSEIAEGKIKLEGAIVRSLPDAKTVLDVHDAGGTWECSIGTGGVPDEDVTLITGSIEVNGQLLDGPFYLLNNTAIREISFVSAGADCNTDVVIRASLFNNSNEVKSMEFEMTDDFREFVNDLGLDWESLDEKNREGLIAAFQLKKEEAAKEDIEDAVEAECAAEPADEKEEEEKPVQASGLAAAKKRVDAIKSVNRPSGYSTRPSENRVIEASLLVSGGAEPSAIEKAGYTQNELNEAMSRNYRDIGLHSIMRRAVKASGLYLPPDCSARELVRTYHEAIQASGLSTRDYKPSGIMTNVADKLLRIQADQINAVADQVFYKRSVKDFNKVTSGKLTSIGAIPEVLNGEDFPNVMVSDDSQDYKIAKRGVNLTITIEDQINDDLGAFERALDQFGRLFANTVDQTAIGSLMSQANTIFTGNQKKTLAFNADNLKTVVGAFARIKDAGGQYRNLVPGAILTSPETAVAARALFVFNDKASIAPQSSSEVFAAPYNVYGTPYIGASDGWFLLPRDEKIGEVAYLNGNSAPAVEQAALNTKNLNLEFLIWGTCGVLIYDDAPAVYSKPA